MTNQGKSSEVVVKAANRSAKEGKVETGFFGFIKSPFKKLFSYFSQVRKEFRYIAWPTFKETRIASIFVFIMIVIAALFFVTVDFGISKIIGYLISLRV